jgi:hypothetical protein
MPRNIFALVYGLKMMPPPHNPFDATEFSLDFIDNLAVPYGLQAASIRTLGRRERCHETHVDDHRRKRCAD